MVEHHGLCVTKNMYCVGTTIPIPAACAFYDCPPEYQGCPLDCPLSVTTQSMTCFVYACLDISQVSSALEKRSQSK